MRKKTLKRFVAIALVLSCSGWSLYAEEYPRWDFHSELDLYLGLKAGTECRISDHFGIRGSFGFCLINPPMFSYTLIWIGHIMKPSDVFQLDLQIGLTQANLNVFDPELEYPCFYWIPGACVAAGFSIPGGHTFRLRGGVGIAFGHDLGEWRTPSIMPNAAIEYGFPVRGAEP